MSEPIWHYRESDEDRYWRQLEDQRQEQLALEEARQNEEIAAWWAQIEAVTIYQGDIPC